ncbi:hypothetical protein [Arthrobacter sp. ISL-65]|uniref:hypothetical protein n=1 Tax=Arthrobacter sp. ISL-65 TaxID=2819112 RepID=UPI001BE9F053|nr:hypothetical protein [Arthrobacter sp. ISL-65]MBT2548606.1 hypothetical protein [Arthrobacter sp. ISL-65]
MVDQVLALLTSDAITAEDTGLWGFGRAADFADRLEELSQGGAPAGDGRGRSGPVPHRRPHRRSITPRPRPRG